MILESELRIFVLQLFLRDVGQDEIFRRDRITVWGHTRHTCKEKLGYT